MQDGISGAAHGDIQTHGVFKRFEVGNITGQHIFVVLFVVSLTHGNNLMPGLDEQFFPICMGGQQRTIAR